MTKRLVDKTKKALPHSVSCPKDKWQTFERCVSENEQYPLFDSSGKPELDEHGNQKYSSRSTSFVLQRFISDYIRRHS